MNQGKTREFVREFHGNLGLNFDLCRESKALESGNTSYLISSIDAMPYISSYSLTRNEEDSDRVERDESS